MDDRGNFHIGDLINQLSIRLNPAIGDTHGQAAGGQGLGEVDMIAQQFAVRADHAGQLHFAHAKRIAAPQPAAPAKVKAGQLPQPVKAKTAGHDRVAGKMASKEPKVGRYVKLGHDMAFAKCAAVFRNLGDPVHHQHRRGGQLGVAGAKQFPPRASQKRVLVECRRISAHMAVPPCLLNCV